MDPHFRLTRDDRNDYQQKFTVCALPFLKAYCDIGIARYDDSYSFKNADDVSYIHFLELDSNLASRLCYVPQFLVSAVLRLFSYRDHAF